jgi:hypothetical protein
MQPESSDGFASVGTILPRKELPCCRAALSAFAPEAFFPCHRQQMRPRLRSIASRKLHIAIDLPDEILPVSDPQPAAGASGQCKIGTRLQIGPELVRDALWDRLTGDTACLFQLILSELNKGTSRTPSGAVPSMNPAIHSGSPERFDKLQCPALRFHTRKAKLSMNTRVAVSSSAACSSSCSS